MANPNRPRKLNSDDRLYRKIEPEMWNRVSGKIAIEAFIDNNIEQSFWVGRIVSPASVLEYFGGMGYYRKKFEQKYGGRKLSPEEMFNEEYRVAMITLVELQTLRLEIKADTLGNEFDKKGHVNVIEARAKAGAISKRAKLLDRRDTFSERN